MERLLIGLMETRESSCPTRLSSATQVASAFFYQLTRSFRMLRRQQQVSMRLLWRQLCETYWKLSNWCDSWLKLIISWRLSWGCCLNLGRIFNYQLNHSSGTKLNLICSAPSQSAIFLYLIKPVMTKAIHIYSDQNNNTNAPSLQFCANTSLQCDSIFLKWI